MILRSAKPEDLSALLTLCRAHASYEGLPFSNSGQLDRWSVAIFGSEPRLFVWVCEVDGAIEGYMTATIDFSTWNAQPFVYLDCLWLEPRVRGRGFGRALMQTLAEFARARGCAEIQWQTPPTNILGLGFYRQIPKVCELSKQRFTWTVSIEVVR